MFLLRYFKHLKKQAAIGSYMRRLPRLLAADYGAGSHYTPAQVRRTIERAGLNKDYSCYAMSMFSSEGDFNTYHAATGEACSYADMRCEIAATHFHGNADFSVGDVSSFGDGGGHHGGGGHDGGGHGGGDGGGGHGG
jgi:hypothetical protein